MAITRNRKRMNDEVLPLLTKIILSRIHDLKTEMRCRCVCKLWYNTVGSLLFDSIHEQWDDSIDDQHYLQSKNVPHMLSQSSKGFGFVSDPITRGYKVVVIHQDKKDESGGGGGGGTYAVYAYNTDSGGELVTYNLNDNPTASISPRRRSAIVWRDVLCWRTANSREILLFHHRENRFQVIRPEFTNDAARRWSTKVRCSKKKKVHATAEA